MDASYRDRLRRLAARWNPSGVFIGDASAYAAVKLLRERPKDASVASLVEAERVYKAAVHPVLEQPIPSAFRHSSFMPVTASLALGMIASKNPSSLLLCARTAFGRVGQRRAVDSRSARTHRVPPRVCLHSSHWLYQSHSAGMRYCNYADTSRPLDGQQMLRAYALSSVAACGIAIGSQR